ncbi:hypothetical protein KC19_VG257600 [Ceratodon purpureus]|uniref:Uncharacterized protein n=1 Tax=Ceratodon purpureus TaxID=3225 RepID=A0A8T0HU41_CERPU|nr:hypothetical protein KC19_VG257600 [Ceratodon purpureus]
MLLMAFVLVRFQRVIGFSSQGSSFGCTGLLGIQGHPRCGMLVVARGDCVLQVRWGM